MTEMHCDHGQVSAYYTSCKDELEEIEVIGVVSPTTTKGGPIKALIDKFGVDDCESYNENFLCRCGGGRDHDEFLEEGKQSKNMPEVLSPPAKGHGDQDRPGNDKVSKRIGHAWNASLSCWGNESDGAENREGKGLKDLLQNSSSPETMACGDRGLAWDIYQYLSGLFGNEEDHEEVIKFTGSWKHVSQVLLPARSRNDNFAEHDPRSTYRDDFDNNRDLTAEPRQGAPASSPRSSQPASSHHKFGKKTNLHRAAEAGDWGVIKRLLLSSKESDVGSLDEAGRTSLMLACRHGPSLPADIAQSLLPTEKSPAPLYITQPQGGQQTCLHVAVAAGCSIEVLNILVGAFRPALALADDRGNLPLHQSIQSISYTCPNTQYLEVAAANSMKSEGSSISIFEEGLRTNESFACQTSIIYLANVCDLLITAYPAALLHQNHKGESPLVLAMFRRASSVVLSLLLQKGGANLVKLTDNVGCNPLHYCFRVSQPYIVRDMASLYPESIMRLNQLGESPLFSAMLDECDTSILCAMLRVCSSPRAAINKRNASGVHLIKFGWNCALTTHVVAAEDQDEEDKRVKTNKSLVVTAQCSSDLEETPLYKCWNKITLLLHAHFHDSIVDGNNGTSLNSQLFSPVVAAAGIDIPNDLFNFILKLHSKEMAMKDDNGNTSCHIALRHSDSISASRLSLIMRKGPAGIAKMQNKDGNTPLHLAILARAPNEALKIVLGSGAEAACITNNTGLSPLFVALATGAPITTLRQILKACPQSVYVKGPLGMSSLEFAWNLLISGSVTEAAGKHFQGEKTRLEQSKRAMSNINAIAMSSRASNLSGDAFKTMGKIDLLLGTAFYGTADSGALKGRTWRAVHAACAGGMCPFDILAYSLQVLPMEIKAVNEDGNLPLHIAASAEPYESNASPGIVEGKAIELLVRSYPAGVMKVDREGRLPLHLALASGKTMAEGIEALIHSFPESIRARDPKTMLFPFMLAACATSGIKKVKSVEADLASLNTIYSLLRKDPAFVRATEVEIDTEKLFLKRQNAQLSSEIHHLRKERETLHTQLEMRMTSKELEDAKQKAKIQKSRQLEKKFRSRVIYLQGRSTHVSERMSQIVTTLR